jgi:hypothetical protein
MSDQQVARNPAWGRIGTALLVTVLVGIPLVVVVGLVMDWSDRRDPRFAQVAQALLAHNADQGRLPPAAVYGPDGQPLLSWRVLVLPYLGHAGLYQEFHLNEPWDSPHNLALLPRMPAVYAPPR